MFTSAHTLEKLPRRLAVEAAYLVARVLWYRSLLASGDTEAVLRKGYKNEIPADVREAVAVILKAIETAEGKSVQALDPASAVRYLNRLSEMISNMSAENQGLDQNQGRTLLSGLREANSAR